MKDTADDPRGRRPTPRTGGRTPWPRSRAGRGRSSGRDRGCGLRGELGLGRGEPHLPPGPAWVEEEHAYNFSLYSRHAERVTLLLFGEADPARPLVVLDLDPRLHKTWDLWHCRLGEDDVRGARYYAYSVDGPRAGGPDHRPGSTRTRSSSTPTRRRSSSRRPSTARPPGSRAPTRAWPPWASCPAPSRRSTGGTTGPRATSRTRSSTRCTCAASRGARRAGSPRGAGHLRRRRREGPLPQGAGRHDRRAAPGAAVRPPGGELLGVHAAELLRPPPVLRGRPGRRAPRVQGDGQGPARGGDRGHPRRRLQPHGRGRPHGADLQLPGDRRRHLLPRLGRPRPPVPGLLRLRQHARLPLRLSSAR